MEKRLTVISILLLLAVQAAFGQVVAGNIHSTPAAIVASTGNITLAWDTSDLATSSINCTAPGFSLPSSTVELAPGTMHTFHMNTSFSGEGQFACTITTYPLNSSPFDTHFISRVNCEGVRLVLLSPSVATAVYFTRPRGSGPYAVNTSIRLSNACTGRAQVASQATPPAGIGMSAPPAIVMGLDSATVPITLAVPDSAEEGLYQGIVRFSSQGSGIWCNLDITVHWPGPKLALSMKEIGNVKSGTNLTWIAEARESLGYRAAENVSCMAWFSDKAQPLQGRDIGRLEPFGKAQCAFTMSFPGRNAKIGNHTAWVKASSSNAGEAAVSSNYTIPAPYMLLAPKELDLGKLTFDSGNDVSPSTLTVIENGGFTPLEGLKFRLLSGDDGWVTLPGCDYAPPGGQANCTFLVALNENASIGVRQWSFGVSSSATGEIAFRAHADVYFIGIDDAVRQLEDTSNYSIMHRFGQAETLKSGAIAMLNRIRSGNENISETSSAIAVHGGAVSLLLQMDEAQARFSSGDVVASGRSLISGRMALDRIASSYRSAKGKGLLGDMGAVYVAAGGLWQAGSREILQGLEQEAVSQEGSNYAASAERYSILSRIYEQEDGNLSVRFASKASDLGEAYELSVAQALEKTTNADSCLEEARGGTVLLGSSRLIISPLSYGGAAENYRLALAGYEEAARLYGLAGSQGELNRLLPRAKSAEAEYELADRAFTAGSIVLSFLVLVLIMRVLVGMQRYREDEDDVETGGVMVR